MEQNEETKSAPPEATPGEHPTAAAGAQPTGQQQDMGAQVPGGAVEAMPEPPRAARALVALPRYRSHKIVQAAKILDESPRDVGWMLTLEVPGPDGGPGKIEQLVLDGWPGDREDGSAVGGYYVRYEDGYESWSPAEAFERGYHPLESVPRIAALEAAVRFLQRRTQRRTEAGTEGTHAGA